MAIAPTPASPTASLGLSPQDPGTMLTPQQITQWTNYFASPGAAYGSGGTGGTPVYQNKLVQTGTQYSPTIPWLTSGQPSSMGLTSGQPGDTSSSLALPWGSLGISGNTPEALANSINASPYAGANPADPYYSLILNQAGQGAQTPVYTQQQVQTGTTPGTPSPYAGVIGGQLYGNLTPEEQSLASYLGVPTAANFLLPNIMQTIQANPGTIPEGVAIQAIQQAGLTSPVAAYRAPEGERG